LVLLDRNDLHPVSDIRGYSYDSSSGNVKNPRPVVFGENIMTTVSLDPFSEAGPFVASATARCTRAL
jgi:hypothetical protein